MASLCAPVASIVIAALMQFVAQCAWADTVFTETRAIHGRIVSLDRTSVRIAPGCSGQETQDLSWGDAREVVFNTQCGSPATQIPSAGGGVCPSTPRQRFLIHLKNAERPIPADAIKLGNDGTLHYADESKLVTGHGPLTDIRGISYGLVCPDDISQAEPPASFCVEPTQFAVNFSYDTPLENTILTRGFSFYLETMGGAAPINPERRKAIQELIRKGFGTALNSWVSVMWKRRDQYDSRIQTYLGGLISTSSHYTLITPPQVVALHCPHAATFVVRVFFESLGPFARSTTRKAAFAQKPGRTILLNFADYECWKHEYERFVIEQQTRCLNIVPILTHELGHAFGLAHVSEPNSIMAGIIGVPKPSDRDADRLAAQLRKSIEGDRAGVFEFVTDNGVAVE